MTEEPWSVTGEAETDNGRGSGSRVVVRVNPVDDSRSFNVVMDEVWDNVQGAMRSAGFHWSKESMDSWVEDKAREVSAARGEF